MAIQIKDTATIARKFASRAQAASPEYKIGVDTTTADWAGNTAAAAENYNQGVTQGIARQAFQRGVTAKGTAGWKEKASNVGSTRYAQGVAGAEAAFAAGFDKFANVLKSLSLPPRAPKGSPQNLERVRAVADALHKAKTG